MPFETRGRNYVRELLPATSLCRSICMAVAERTATAKIGPLDGILTLRCVRAVFRVRHRRNARQGIAARMGHHAGKAPQSYADQFSEPAEVAAHQKFRSLWHEQASQIRLERCRRQEATLRTSTSSNCLNCELHMGSAALCLYIRRAHWKPSEHRIGFQFRFELPLRGPP